MRMMLLALQLAVAQEAAVQVARDSGKVAIRARIATAAEAFHVAWRSSWQRTQEERRPRYATDEHFATPTDLRRSHALHCHWDSGRREVRNHLVARGHPAHAWCPQWYPLEDAVEDERRGIDRGLTEELRLVMNVFRLRLRRVLDSAATALPGDLMVAEQRVRYALDAGDLKGAAVAAAACDEDPGRCGMLQGYVLYRVGLAPAADSAFSAALRLMNAETRCRWSDVSELLERGARDNYESLPCAARADVESRLWWLSDPLYLEPGNERRAEHFARRVEVAIRATFDRDERLRWDRRRGGENVSETVVRYGWPAHLYWLGAQADRGHDEWLAERGVDVAPPYVVPEYTRGRIHTVPRRSALDTPLAAKPDDWELNAPRDAKDWWPVEHYARDASRIVEFPQGQIGMLRRREHTRFVWALELDSATLARAKGDAIRASLFRSSSPIDVTNAGEFPGHVGAPLRLQAALAGGATLVALEVPGDSAVPAARTRFGMEIAAPLSALAAGRAVSQPLLYDPPDDGPVALPADSAVPRMYPTTSFDRDRVKRLGVYWEAYGFAGSDTVDTQVRISRDDRSGVFARVASAFGIGSTEGGSITLRWQETQRATRAIQAAEGSVPLQMRSIALEISQLPPGTYTLTVSASRPGDVPVTSARTFILR